MTVEDLIDYLQQFPAEMRVVMHDEDVEEPGDYVALDSIPTL